MAETEILLFIVDKHLYVVLKTLLLLMEAVDVIAVDLVIYIMLLLAKLGLH